MFRINDFLEFYFRLLMKKLSFVSVWRIGQLVFLYYNVRRGVSDFHIGLGVFWIHDQPNLSRRLPLSP